MLEQKSGAGNSPVSNIIFTDESEDETLAIFQGEKNTIIPEEGSRVRLSQGQVGENEVLDQEIKGEYIVQEVRHDYVLVDFSLDDVASDRLFVNVHIDVTPIEERD